MVLDPRFLPLPCQAISVRCEELEVVGGVDWAAVVREGRGRGRVTRGAGAGAGHTEVELFMRTEAGLGPEHCRVKSQLREGMDDGFHVFFCCILLNNFINLFLLIIHHSYLPRRDLIFRELKVIITDDY